MAKIKVFIVFLVGINLHVFANFPRIPRAFYDAVGSKVCQGGKRLVIWNYDYSGYLITFRDSTFTEYFMYCDTANYVVHAAVIHQYTYSVHGIKDIHKTQWQHNLNSSARQELADSLNVFFHYDEPAYAQIDTIYKALCCINFPAKTVWMYDENDNKNMCLTDDELGFVTNPCLSFILRTIYLNYDYGYYWQQECHPETKWWKERRRNGSLHISHRLKRWFASKRAHTIQFPYSIK